MGVLSKIVQRIGWSPIGKKLQIRIDDSESKNLIGNVVSGTITALMGSNAARITLMAPMELHGEKVSEVWAYARHKGFDFFRLPVGFIAVDLVIEDPMNPNCPAGASFAICSIKLDALR